MRVLQAHKRVTWFTTQVLLVLLGVLLYFGTRGLTEARPGGAIDHAHQLLRFEDALDLDVEKRAQRLLDGRTWLADLVNWIYIWGHWPVIVAVMVWLGLRHRSVFLRLRNGMLASGAAGLLVFVTWPVAPPRLVDVGVVDTVTQRSHAYRVLQPPAFVNQYAAMPSLHVGWDLLVGLAVVAAATPLALRAVGLMMPLLMGAAVLLTGNHFVLDIVAGVVIALAGHAVALAWERRPVPAPALPSLPRPRTSDEWRTRSRQG